MPSVVAVLQVWSPRFSFVSYAALVATVDDSRIHAVLYLRALTGAIWTIDVLVTNIYNPKDPAGDEQVEIQIRFDNTVDYDISSLNVCLSTWLSQDQ